MTSEYYVSVDIESDGPIPGEYSMLSLGAYAFDVEGKPLGEFEVNLQTLPMAKQDPDTMQWWATQKEAWEDHRKNTVPASQGMHNFANFVNGISKRTKKQPVFVGYPAGFDFTFVYWYLIKFVGNSPFSFSALDIKSYASALLTKDYRKSTKKGMPKRWFRNAPKHTHKALDDAKGQAALFINMLEENHCG